MFFAKLRRHFLLTEESKASDARMDDVVDKLQAISKQLSITAQRLEIAVDIRMKESKEKS